MTIPGDVTVTFNPLVGILGAVLFLGGAVMLYSLTMTLSRMGLFLSDHSPFSQIHFFLIGILLVPIAVALSLLSGWGTAAPVAVVAVLFGGLSDTSYDRQRYIQ